MKEVKCKCAAFDPLGDERKNISGGSILGRGFEDIMNDRSSTMYMYMYMKGEKRSEK